VFAYLYFTCSNSHDFTITNLPTLFTHALPLLSLILRIPPATSASAALRTSYLLRLTNEIHDGLLIFILSDSDAPEAFDGLEKVDVAWECVLLGKAWNGEVVDVEGRGMGATERVRLKSLLLNVKEAMREALMLPPKEGEGETVIPTCAEPATPSMVSDSGAPSVSIDDDSEIDGDVKPEEEEIIEGDAAATMRMVLDPDASDEEDEENDDDEADGSMQEAEMPDAMEKMDQEEQRLAGELETATGRVFERSLRLLSQ